MKLELWRPLLDLEKEFDALFRPSRMGRDGGEFDFRPSIDVERTDGELIITAELPGIDPDKDVEITLQDDYLTISGEKSEEREISEENRYLRERHYGKFVRRVPVPDGVTEDMISADYDRGVLTVTVKLPEEAQPPEPRKIPVAMKG
jgi:HSP20 family molecular chaperone IbpA